MQLPENASPGLNQKSGRRVFSCIAFMPDFRFLISDFWFLISDFWFLTKHIINIPYNLFRSFQKKNSHYSWTVFFLKGPDYEIVSQLPTRTFTLSRHDCHRTTQAKGTAVDPRAIDRDAYFPSTPFRAFYLRHIIHLDATVYLRDDTNRIWDVTECGLVVSKLIFLSL